MASVMSLTKCHPHSIVSTHTRIRYPDQFVIGEDSIVDDFSYFSTRINVGKHSHLAARLTIGGGPDHKFVLGDYSGICSGTCIYVSSNDFATSLITYDSPSKTHGDVIFGNYTGIGCNSMVMPDNNIPEGVAIGALSFVPSKFQFRPWMVYAGNPLRLIGPRQQRAVMAQVRAMG